MSRREDRATGTHYQVQLLFPRVEPSPNRMQQRQNSFSVNFPYAPEFCDLTCTKLLISLALPREPPLPRNINHLAEGLGEKVLTGTHSVSPGLPKPSTQGR